MFSVAVLAALWLVVAWRTPTLWQEPWKRAPWVALAALAVALTAGLTRPALVLDRWTCADFSTLVKHVAGVVAAAAVLHWLDSLASPERHRYRRHILGTSSAVIAGMTGLFIVMPRPESATWTVHVTGGAGAAYLLLMYAYLGVALSVASRVFARASRKPRGTARWGLWLLAAGTATGTAYAAYMSISLVLRMTHAVTVPAGQALLTAGAVPQTFAIAAILAGLSVPAVGVACRAAWDLWALWKLRQLWRTMVGVAPDVELGPVRQGPAGVVGAVRIRLIRRVCECRDAALALGCYVPPGAVTSARSQLEASGLAGDKLQAAVEARWLEMAIQAAADGQPAEHPPHIFCGGDTLQDEVRQLRQVAEAVRPGITRMLSAR